MIYLLKFGSSFLLIPGIFFLIFWGMSIYLWRRDNHRISIALASITVIFYILSTSWVSGLLLGSLEHIYDQPELIQGDSIVMLGGGATKDTPSLGEMGNLTCNPTARMMTAFELYQQLHVPIIVSGGQIYADSGPEAVIAKRELMRLGVQEQDIIMEPNSLNTRQNAIFTAEILREKHLTKPILVTSAFHMERSVLNFQKQGIEVQPCPTDFVCNRHRVFHYNKLMPSADSLQESNLYFREKLRTFVTRHFE